MRKGRDEAQDQQEQNTALSASDAVGLKLKRLRERSGLSQRELARSADVTNGTLSNIEQGKVSPSISSLEKILRALDISMPEFFSDEAELSPSVFREEHFVRLHKGDTDYQILPLNEIHDGAYLAKQTYAPGAKISSEWIIQKGLIAGIVISGELELHIEGQSHPLSAGEGFNFSIERPHAFFNKQNEECVVVFVSLKN